MPQMVRRGTPRPFQALCTNAILSLMVASAIVITGCRSASAAGASPRPLHVEVIALRPGLAPYNPMLASGGVPVELVTFTVGGADFQPFTCTLVLRHSGKIVGRTVYGFGAPPPVRRTVPRNRWTVQVDVSGPTFSGRPADAHVSCHL